MVGNVTVISEWPLCGRMVKFTGKHVEIAILDNEISRREN